MGQHNSLFDKVISKPRSFKQLLGITALLLLVLLIAVLLDGVKNDFTRNLSWRGLLIPPTIIVYILAVAPAMDRIEKQALVSLRAIILLDDAKFQETIDKTVKIRPQAEMGAIGVGIILGALAAANGTDEKLTWLSLYWQLTSIFMYALLVWTIFVSIASTRLTSAMLRQPLKVDPFNTVPFEPIGRQSLMIALVFIGGITLSVIIVGLDLASFKQPLFWLVYIPLAIVPVILFFLNMIPTHRVLTNAKAQELASVRDQLQKACRKLLQHIEQNHETNNLPWEINALAIYEKQLKETRTWPYNTAMLRTLFFSVLIPVGTVVGRIIAEVVSN